MRLSTLSLAAAACVIASAAFAGSSSSGPLMSGTPLFGGRAAPMFGHTGPGGVAVHGHWGGRHGGRVRVPSAYEVGPSRERGVDRHAGHEFGDGHRLRASRPHAPTAVHRRDGRGWSRVDWREGAARAPGRDRARSDWARRVDNGRVIASGGGAEAPLLRSFAEPPLAPTAHYVVSIQPQIIYVGPPPRHGANVRVVSGTPGAGASRYARPGTRWRDAGGTEWVEY